MEYKNTHNKVNVYQRNQLRTVATNVQVAVVLEKVARALESALDAEERGAIEERYKQSSYAMRLIKGLAAVLDNSGEETKQITQVLTDYYSFILVKISEFNLKGDKDLLKRLLDSLKDMANCWRFLDNPPSQES
jgi:flagellin-specific chaperone FliS